jgi:Fe-S-cluster containining protein
MPTPDHTSRILAQDHQLVQIMDAAFARATERSGKHLLCRPGCTQCCHGAFAVDSLDALRIRAGMAALRLEQPVLAALIEARAAAYLAEFGPAFPGDPATGALGQDDQSQEAFEEFANEAACPALDPESGRCDIYASRPMTCRVFGPPVRSGQEGGLAVCELCFTSAAPEEIAACEMPLPLDEEEQLLELIGDSRETIVAFCLLPPPPSAPTTAS